jgi:hypothetical protein
MPPPSRINYGATRMNFRSSKRAPPSAAENAKTTAWVAAVVTAGGSVSAGRRTLVDNLFNSMDASALTPARLWLHAAEDSQSALIDLYGLASASAVNSPTFTANQGYQGNGTSSYLNLGSTNAGTQNSTSFGVYLRTNKAGRDEVDISASSGSVSHTSNLVAKWSDGVLYGAVNDNNGDGGRAAPGTVSGIYVMSRTASTGFVVYRAGASFATSAQTSSGVASTNYCTLASINQFGTAVLFSSAQYGMSVLAGTGWDATQVSNFTTHIQTYLTAVGA